jgi:hypothetical protein
MNYLEFTYDLQGIVFTRDNIYKGQYLQQKKKFTRDNIYSRKRNLQGAIFTVEKEIYNCNLYLKGIQPVIFK